MHPSQSFPIVLPQNAALGSRLDLSASVSI
jgi:hypothetical protein